MNLLKRYLSLSLLFVLGCSNSNWKPESSTQLTGASDSIVGGIEVQKGAREIVSTVLLYNKVKGYLCTGTIIDTQIVLTAGHCVEGDASELIVVFSEKIEGIRPENVRPVVSFKRNENYGTKKAKNMADIAVIRFNPLQGLPEGYAPARILTDFSVLQPGQKIVAAGYGVNRAWILKRGAGVLRTAQLEISDPAFSETEVLVDQSLKRGVCSGDSGGPGYVEIEGQLYLWGVVSRGDSIPIPLVPDCFLFSVYTRVDYYASWIDAARVELLGNVPN